MSPFADLLFSIPELTPEEQERQDIRVRGGKLCSCGDIIPLVSQNILKTPSTCKKCKAADKALKVERTRLKQDIHQQALLAARLESIAPLIEQHGLWAARSPYYLQKQLNAKRKALIKLLRARDLHLRSQRRAEHLAGIAERKRLKAEMVAADAPRECKRCGETKPLSKFKECKGYVCNTCAGRRSKELAKLRRKFQPPKPPYVPPKMPAAERLRRDKESKRLSKIKARQDPMRRINRIFSECIRRQFRQIRAGKSCGGWKRHVGYTLLDLKRHLEAQFTEGMSWENYGTWHIDHIRPKSSFTFTGADDPQFLECWGLHNLQPLWGVENSKKGAKYPRL